MQNHMICFVYEGAVYLVFKISSFYSRHYEKLMQLYNYFQLCL